MKFPYYASGTVVHGFGRGGKQLGIPTANFPNEVVDELPIEYDQGVYYGWAQVDNGDIYRMVMSIGNNPYFNNEKRTMVRVTFFFVSILKVSKLRFVFDFKGDPFTSQV
jgi:FAD synthase